ncbi:MAG TPA: hypothetical protein VKD23_00560, partial [Terriglobales bacterium]|nr:hypothetical protein [Terriglobales bacterium]
MRSKWAAGPAAAGREEGAYLNRYVTDEQRSRRPVFIATLRAVASWLFFCGASHVITHPTVLGPKPVDQE